MTFEADHKLQLKVDDVVSREVEDELVILELSTSTYMTLNGSGKYLWERLVDGSTLDDLVSSLVDRYSITSEQARADVESFVAELDDRELIAHDA